MDAIVRATCPACGTGLRIPAQWVGQAVKCKKCGSVVRSKPKDEKDQALSLDATTPPPNGHYNSNGHSVPAPGQNSFDFSKPTLNDEPFPLPEPIAPSETNRANFNPFPEDNAPPQSAPHAPAMPGYPGYPPPGAYTPPGYPYPMPPGYPYPMPPGYGPPGAYPLPPGYPYPLPPGYGPPGAYPIPPGYPYAAPPGMMPPEASNPPAMPPATTQASASNPQAPLVNAPIKPIAIARPKDPAPVLPIPNIPHQSAANIPQTAPDPVPPSSEFKTDSHVSAASPRRYQRRADGKEKIVWIAICAVMTVLLATAGIVFFNKTTEKAEHEKKLSTDPTKLVELLGSSDGAERDQAEKALREQGSKAENALKVGLRSENAEIAKKSKELLALLAGSGPGHVAVEKKGPFPRRLLFIHISKYMFLNPLTSSAPGASDKTKAAAFRMTFDMRVPNDKDNSQLYVISDTAPPERNQEVQVPLKNVVMGAYERFFESSRAQDRIVVYFGGHAVELEGKAYIAPVEGDLDDPTSLIPLEEFYSKMKACKATQKIVIWDVCRFNPDRGRARIAGTSVMTESLAKSLADAPPGVEVITTCQPGENALEFYSISVENKPYSGSSFLESLRAAGEKKQLQAKTATDPIPIAEWTPMVATQLNKMAEHSTGEQKKQTLKFDGKPPSTLVAYNPDEPLPKRFEMPVEKRGIALNEINSIVQEFTVPPIKNDSQDTGLTDLPFREDVMKNYKSDVSINQILADKEQYKFQARILEALQTVREVWTGGGDKGVTKMYDVIDKEQINDTLKKQIANDLEFWAVSIAKLELVSSELDSVGGMKEAQSKRWQAHYEYARAVVKTRLAYMNEYNKLMGDVRTETLPPLDKEKGQTQYRLISSEKLKSKKDVQKLAEEAQEAYNILITQHKGTPWAIQAKREKSFSLGLQWSPAVGPGSEPKAP